MNNVREIRNANTARGVALLDRKKPGWAHHIAIGRLDLDHGYACILGQVFGDFYVGARKLRGGHALSDWDFGWTVRYGFNSEGGSRAAWIRAVKARKAKDLPPDRKGQVE